MEVSRCSRAKQRQRNVQKKCAARTKLLLLIGHLHDDIILIYYYDQNPSGFCFLVQIKAFVIQTSLGLQNLNMKGKTKRILVVVVK